MFWLKIEHHLFALYFVQVRMLLEEGGTIPCPQQTVVCCFYPPPPPGCHSFPARLPEQHGVRLETAELHRGHPRGKRTLAGVRPPGFLRPVTDRLVVIVAPMGVRDVAWLQQLA